MLNTAKNTARNIATMLAEYGVRQVVVSPGSRNAPLLVAIEREKRLNARVVIDERSAAFIALGISLASGNQPVAVVCTSGTAPLNYAPALAEAFYRGVPLIAITADRPEEWIDQDDSQTIVQPGIFANFVKGECDIPVENGNPDQLWMINRKLNDVLSLATTGAPGPVHINVRLSDPLGKLTECEDEKPRIIRTVETGGISETDSISELAAVIKSGKRTMILCGFMPSDNGLSEALGYISAHTNTIVLHEAQSNLKVRKEFIPNIDGTLTRLEKTSANTPEIVVTLGGSLTSRMIKTYLRGVRDLTHWSIGVRDHSVDCFRRLASRVSCSERTAIEILKNLLSEEGPQRETDFKTAWERASEEALSEAEEMAAECPWSDFKAMEFILRLLPEGSNLQLSNGTAVRYTQLFNYSRAATIHCNRGVSGIDGCTSTAIGFAAMADSPTILITGDMSMQYDIGALATTFIPSNFKIIVLNNGGGGIFRFIDSTRHLPELEKYFVADVRLPLRQLSEAYGFNYFKAENIAELEKNYSNFLAANNLPSILEIKTDGNLSAEILRQYLKL